MHLEKHDLRTNKKLIKNQFNLEPEFKINNLEEIKDLIRNKINFKV